MNHEPRHILGNKRSPAYDRALALFRMDKSPRSIWNALHREGYSVSDYTFDTWMQEFKAAELADRMKSADRGDFHKRAVDYYGRKLRWKHCPKRGGLQYYVDGQPRDVASMGREMIGKA